MSLNQSLQTQNWRQLASVQVGGAICLPLLIVGYELAKYNDPVSTLLSILWGNSILFALSLIAGLLSLKRTITTAEHASFYFGKHGKGFFGITLALSMLGWFAIQSQCMGTDLYQMMRQFEQEPSFNSQGWILIFSLILAAFIIIGVFWGLTFLTRMADFCVPLLVLTIGYAVYSVAKNQAFTFSFTTPFTWWDGKGVSLVLASSIAATIDLPTFYRHANHPRSMIGASIATYLVAMPLVQLAGMWLYHGTQAETISEALAHSSTSIWKIWITIFMLIAGWTTNNMNLYSASLSLKSLSTKISFHSAMGIAGLIGMGFVTIPLLERFASVLDLMGIFVVAMGGVILMAFILESSDFPSKPILSWLAWILGIGTGLAELKFPELGSGAPVLDAGIVSVFVLLIAYSGKKIKNSLLMIKEIKNDNG